MTDLNIEPSPDFDSARQRDPYPFLPIDPNANSEENLPPSMIQSQRRLAALIHFVNKQLTEVIELASGQRNLLILDPSLEMLDKLRNSLLLLMVHDHSRNVVYAKNLSEAWNELLDYFPPSMIGKIGNSKIGELLRQLITNIKTYPKTADHSLGYYLQKYTGEHWLPFPFIAILKELHEAHATQGENSDLSKWIDELTQVIDYFSAFKETKPR